MHRGHDHEHAGNGAGPGHNHAAPPRPLAQWQTPHIDSGHADDHAPPGEPDLDLVEIAFADAFMIASDPTSFLRLAQVPFEAKSADGEKLVLLRVEVEAVTDVGSTMPHLGGETFRYDPLPAALVARRRRLRFIYSDGQGPRALTFAEVRALTAV
ncbi:MAG: hypothetical protein QOD40_2117 [Alphaproteobacteria bacterium]|jgi:hypothetical protein|nr:hypothetical protein [Alphaproteobacteria bacterium]